MASNMRFRGMPAEWRDVDNRVLRLTDDDDGDSWARVERKKRQRRSTGGIEIFNLLMLLTPNLRSPRLAFKKA